MDAFADLKTKLTVPPILALPDVDKGFHLRTDASNVGVGAVILQYEDGIPKPIAYASRKLSNSEKNYSAIEKECLAMVWAIGKFKFYLYGKSFTIETDHQPLVFIKNFKGTNSRIMRWALNLQSHKFQIMYIKGKDNIGADLLSRLPRNEH